jgi:hypothetical protein
VTPTALDNGPRSPRQPCSPGGAVVFGIIAWIALELDDKDEWENAWTVLLLVAISLGGGWALGVGAGYWVRQRFVRNREREA